MTRTQKKCSSQLVNMVKQKCNIGITSKMIRKNEHERSHLNFGNTVKVLNHDTLGTHSSK
uniref:Uncharacterized protein n=1 Tax=Arion vulgaris TaxID=1028688 RepID=A0A0B6YZV8_9EUPU